MKIGVIGISSLTLKIACRSSQADYEVIINNPKGNNLIKEAIKNMEPQVKIGTVEEATKAKLIFFFIPKDDLENFLKSLPGMSGKIVVLTGGLILDHHLLLSDIKNAFNFKIVSELLTQSTVIKLFNPSEIKSKKNPTDLIREDIYFMSEHSQAKKQIQVFLKKIYYNPI